LKQEYAVTDRRLVRFVELAGWSAALASIASAIALPELARTPAIQWSPWLLGLFVLGIPHGAFDHRVGLELKALQRDGPVGSALPTSRVGPGFYAAYLAAAMAVLALWFVSPIAASSGFLLMAAAHFGQGDVYWSRRFGLAGRAGSVGYRGSLIVVRSVVPIALPLLAFPREFAGAADELASRLFGRGSWSIPPSSVAVGLGMVGGMIGIQVIWAAVLAWRGDGETRRSAKLDISETLLLVALFATVPPVLALGVYFNAWHSLRHVARLLMIAPSTRDLVGSGQLLSAFIEFQKRALPMSLGALAMMIALALVVGRSLVSVVDLGLVALVALSALTLPHVLVVAWMDARQGVWSARPDQG